MEILLWSIRIKNDLTLVELSKLTGISKTRLNKIENGITSPTLSELEILSVALNVGIVDLFESERKFIF